MESALVSASQFLPSQNRELGGLIKNVQTSFFGKQICLRSFVGKELDLQRGSTRKIVSVLGGKVKNETVVPDPDYRIPIVLLGAAGGLAYADNLLAAAPVGLLGLLLLFQTTRVKFVFDAEALLIIKMGSSLLFSYGVLVSVEANSVAMLEVKIGEQLDESGENVFVGGKSRWKYSSFVNWELWWPNFPILVYFKETQTKPEGQIHFFPIIFNGKQLYDVMVERAGPSKTSGPKP